MKYAAAAVLFALALFCVFGFMGSFEAVGVTRVAWASAYAALGVGSVAGAVYCLTRRLGTGPH